MPTLAEVLAAAGLTPPEDAAAVEVRSVVHDSRQASPGAVFVAVPGLHVDGHTFAADAVRAGAVAVVAQRPPQPEPPAGIPVILVRDTRPMLAPLAAAAWGHPSRSLLVAGITGTDGKTTTTTMLHAAWQGAGMRAGSLTTVDFRTGDSVEPNLTRQTTLEADDLQRRLRALLDAGCDRAALETSSHALVLHRVDSVDYRVAVYTRITSEHLDFHGTREAYIAAKARLLERVARREDGIGVLDADDTEVTARLLAQAQPGTVLRYSLGGDPGADLLAERLHADSAGVHLSARTPWGRADLDLRLAGRFNAANALAALGAACATGATLQGALDGLARLERVGGRMERVDLGQPFSVVVDYAHTAEALAAVLRELRVATSGRLWVVFGSAGERDVPKRAAMGRVAAELADVAVVTDEDPRDEDGDAIVEQIAAGARQGGRRDGVDLFVVRDRAQAIRLALDGAQDGDTVLCAGKGHESNILGPRGSAVPWDERAACEAALRERLDRGGVGA